MLITISAALFPFTFGSSKTEPHEASSTLPESETFGHLDFYELMLLIEFGP